MKKRFWENIHFGREVVWYGVNQEIIHLKHPKHLKHPFRQLAVILFILFYKILFFCREPVVMT